MNRKLHKYKWTELRIFQSEHMPVTTTQIKKKKSKVVNYTLVPVQSLPTGIEEYLLFLFPAS